MIGDGLRIVNDRFESRTGVLVYLDAESIDTLNAICDRLPDRTVDDVFAAGLDLYLLALDSVKHDGENYVSVEHYDPNEEVEPR